MDAIEGKLQGLDKAWVSMRRNNKIYLTNKFLSTALAGAMAVVTTSYKPTLQAYSVTYAEDVETIQSYDFSYWLVFIYYSFACLDELIELYAVWFNREKGALGLLFEMNYFLGAGVAIYLTWFVYQEHAVLPLEFTSLYNFLFYQVIVLYVTLGLCLFMFICMGSMQRKYARKERVRLEKSASEERI